MKDQQASYPQLRFKGFTDPWEERKLSSISERVTRKNKNNESTLPLTISAQDGLVDQNDFFNKQVASRDVTGYFLVKNGEFAYNKSYSNGYPWGAIKRLDKYDMGVLSTLYIVFRPTKINSQFLVSYYDTTRWYREVSKNAAEGARNHGLLNIAPTDFFNTLLVVPKIVDEQQKIGSFFKQLDDTITLHQRKLAKLKEHKQGYLQKLFPRNGSKFPQLRFAGFADAWEQRKLSDIATLNARIGWQNLRTSEFLESGDYMLITGTNFHDGTVDYSTVHYVEKNRYEQDTKIQVENGSILITKDGTLGKVALVQGLNMPATLNAGVFNVKIKDPETIDVDYVYQYLAAPFLMKYANAKSTGGTIKHLNQNILIDFPVLLPRKREQVKLAELLNGLDNTITLHQRKLEKLQELKKGYLQKMFC